MIAHMARLPKVCEHLNIPVQSGDDACLRRMKRGYTLDEYREKIASVRSLWPGVALSTDIIVGFCGESEQEFQHTLDLLAEIRFDVVHVAMYSLRPGTLAARWEDDVPLAEEKRRLHALEEVQARIALELNQQLVESVVEVMVEETNTSHGRLQWKGRTRGNKWVFFPQPGPEAAARLQVLRPGDLVRVHIEKVTSWSLQGCAVEV
jgi:tRNA-2-methylthio-N6-dimethylallyladenosine synthase